MRVRTGPRARRRVRRGVLYRRRRHSVLTAAGDPVSIPRSIDRVLNCDILSIALPHAVSEPPGFHLIEPGACYRISSTNNTSSRTLAPPSVLVLLFHCVVPRLWCCGSEESVWPGRSALKQKRRADDSEAATEDEGVAIVRLLTGN